MPKTDRTSSVYEKIGIEPIINTGIAHKEAGVGQIGAGITRAPITVFNDAIIALANKMTTI